MLHNTPRSPRRPPHGGLSPTGRRGPGPPRVAARPASASTNAGEFHQRHLHRGPAPGERAPHALPRRAPPEQRLWRGRPPNHPGGVQPPEVGSRPDPRFTALHTNLAQYLQLYNHDRAPHPAWRKKRLNLEVTREKIKDYDVATTQLDCVPALLTELAVVRWLLAQTTLATARQMLLAHLDQWQ